METAASPAKRRVLGQLDPNASPRPTRLDAKQAAHAPNSPLKKVTVFSASPSQPEQAKRPLLFGEVAGELLHPAKKVCQEDSRGDMAVQPRPEQSNTAPERRHSGSPEPSSLFDTSAVDTSQATTITEPDVVAVTAAAAAAASTLSPTSRPGATRPRLTREEAREKAEILKLRLGLASYKLRTGQTDVPLEQLELRSSARTRAAVQSRTRGSAAAAAGWASSRLQAQLRLQREQIAAAATASASANSEEGASAGAGAARRPLPGAAPLRRGSSEGEVDADASFSSQVQWSQGSSQQEGAAGGEGGEGESRGEEWSQQTPKGRQIRGVEAEEERLTSSALRGGAASGLLSLANARS